MAGSSVKALLEVDLIYDCSARCPTGMQADNRLPGRKGNFPSAVCRIYERGTAAEEGFLLNGYFGLTTVGVRPSDVLPRILLFPDDWTVPPAPMPVEHKMIETCEMRVVELAAVDMPVV